MFELEKSTSPPSVRKPRDINDLYRVVSNDVAPRDILSGRIVSSVAGYVLRLPQVFFARVTLVADGSNSDDVYVGSAGVDPTNGMILDAGDSMSFDYVDGSSVNMHFVAAADIIRFYGTLIPIEPDVYADRKVYTH